MAREQWEQARTSDRSTGRRWASFQKPESKKLGSSCDPFPEAIIPDTLELSTPHVSWLSGRRRMARVRGVLTSVFEKLKGFALVLNFRTKPYSQVARPRRVAIPP